MPRIVWVLLIHFLSAFQPSSQYQFANTFDQYAGLDTGAEVGELACDDPNQGGEPTTVGQCMILHHSFCHRNYSNIHL